MATMLREIGIDSYHVSINTERGSVTPDTPANLGFDHVILAIKIPSGISETSLVAVADHPKLGRLFFLTRPPT